MKNIAGIGGTIIIGVAGGEILLAVSINDIFSLIISKAFIGKLIGQVSEGVSAVVGFFYTSYGNLNLLWLYPELGFNLVMIWVGCVCVSIGNAVLPLVLLGGTIGGAILVAYPMDVLIDSQILAVGTRGTIIFLNQLAPGVIVGFIFTLYQLCCTVTQECLVSIGVLLGQLSINLLGCAVDYADFEDRIIYGTAIAVRGLEPGLVAFTIGTLGVELNSWLIYMHGSIALSYYQVLQAFTLTIFADSTLSLQISVIVANRVRGSNTPVITAIGISQAVSSAVILKVTILGIDIDIALVAFYRASAVYYNISSSGLQGDILIITSVADFVSNIEISGGGDLYHAVIGGDGAKFAQLVVGIVDDYIAASGSYCANLSASVGLSNGNYFGFVQCNARTAIKVQIVAVGVNGTTASICNRAPSGKSQVIILGVQSSINYDAAGVVLGANGNATLYLPEGTTCIKPVSIDVQLTII